MSFEDRVIAALLKSSARGFTAVADIDNIKKDNIAKIRGMNEGKFKKRCLRIYNNLQDLPPGIKDEYKFSPDMTKEQVVAAIDSLDKKKIYAIIDAAPDEMLAAMFKRHLARTKQDLRSGNFVVCVRRFWDSVVNSISAPKPKTP